MSVSLNLMVVGWCTSRCCTVADEGFFFFSVAEVLQAPIYNDISVAQWLGLTPKQAVKGHLGFSDETLERLPQAKPYILPGGPDLSRTNFTETKL
jgi:hypothetical protein